MTRNSNPAKRPPIRDVQPSDNWDIPVPVGFLNQQETPLPWRLKHLILVLEGFARYDCFAYPTNETLTKRCGVKETQIRDRLVKLEDAGWIKRITMTNSNRSLRVILLLKRVRDRFRLHVVDPQNGPSEDEILCMVLKKLKNPKVRSAARRNGAPFRRFSDATIASVFRCQN